MSGNNELEVAAEVGGAPLYVPIGERLEALFNLALATIMIATLFISIVSIVCAELGLIPMNFPLVGIFIVIIGTLIVLFVVWALQILAEGQLKKKIVGLFRTAYQDYKELYLVAAGKKRFDINDDM